MSFFGCDKNIIKRKRKNYKRDENTYMLKKVFLSLHLQYPAFYPQFYSEMDKRLLGVFLIFELRPDSESL